MPITFVALYLFVTVAIGLWAARAQLEGLRGRRAQRTAFHEHGARIRHLVRRRDRARRVSDFPEGGHGRDRRRSVRLLVLSRGGGALLRARVLPAESPHHRRFLPRPLQQAGGGGGERVHHTLIPGLDVGPARRAGRGVSYAVGRRNFPAVGHGPGDGGGGAV